MEAAARPVEPGERLDVLDVLRGFAIAGIVFVNIRFFSTPVFSALEYRVADDFPGLGDRLAEWLVMALAEGKFYPLLALLFGYGFGVQLARGGPGPRYVRRLVGLFVLGAAHAVFVWAGDILVAYAVAGALLPLFRRSSDRSVVRWAAVLLAVHVVLLLSNAFLALAVDEPADAAAAATEAYRGSWSEVQAQRVRDTAVLVPAAAVLTAPGFLGLFLLGLWAQRRDLLRRPREHERLLRRTAAAGLLAGGAASLAFATLWWLSDGRGVVGALAYALSAGGFAQALGYAAGVILVVERGRARALMLLRPVGRLALSNYLFQSLVATTIFYGYGLGLYREVGPAAGLAVAAGIVAAGAAWSALWLRAFRFGPFEWLLRSFTYARPQPLR